MATAVSKQRFRLARIPNQLLGINYVGIPVSGDVTKRAWGRSLALRKFGPNDGISRTIDEIIPTYPTIVELGLDHYFTNHDIEVETVAFLKTIVRQLENTHKNKS